jgi:DNA-binding PucR family transcriptional regulator
LRLTHRQAQAALRVALRRPKRLTRYGDVMLLAAVLQDDVSARSLVDTYLSPLDGLRDGPLLRGTLYAYFEAGRNVTTAAAALGVERRTVSYRLQAFEERLGCRLGTCLPEVELALRLGELGMDANHT